MSYFIISFIAISLLTIGSINSIDTTTCNTPGWFYPNTCSPAQCPKASNPPCSINETIDLNTIEQSVSSMTCNSSITQSTHPMCKNASLIQLFNKGIVAVYCTNKFLIIITNDEPNHPVNLMDIPHPPAGSSVGGYAGCVTRKNTMQFNVYKIPLYPVDLGISTLSNNNQLGSLDSFPDGTSKTPILGTQPLQYYPIPAEGTVGVTITGIGYKVPYSRNGYFKNFILIISCHYY
jgi:hypothetical protein